MGLTDVAPGEPPGGQPVAEITESITYTGHPCKQCGGPVVAPRRANVVKDFCRDKCRANWRLDEQRRAVDRLQANLGETKAELGRAKDALLTVAGEVDRLAAVTEGALAFIRQHLVIGRRKKRSAGPVESS